MVVARRTPLRFLTAFRGGGEGGELGRDAGFFFTDLVGFFFATAFFVAVFRVAAGLPAAFLCVVFRLDFFLEACRETVFFFVALFFAAFFFAIEFGPSALTPRYPRQRD